MRRTPKAPSDEGSKATSNETIAGGNRTYDYVSAKLTGGEKKLSLCNLFLSLRPFGAPPSSEGGKALPRLRNNFQSGS